MKRYIVSPEAQQDLRDIRKYILDEAGIAVARSVLQKIIDGFIFLAETPGAGHLREDLTDETMKFWSVFSYLIVYDHLVSPIGIARVIHSSRDIAALFLKEPLR